MNNRIKLLILTLIGLVLRISNLGDNPLWIDEALYGLWVRENGWQNQEFFTIAIGKLFNLTTEFQLRLPSVIAGTLTIPAMYYACNTRKIELSFVVAVFPLFVFWSRMARPYAVAGLFVVLSWRWWWCLGIAILSTPVAIIGTRITKENFVYVSIVIAAGILFFFIRQDWQRFNIDYLLNVYNHSRLLYVPFLTILLYIGNYLRIGNISNDTIEARKSLV